MLHPYLTFADGTMVLHSDLTFLANNAHLLYEYAAQGGLRIA